MSIKYDPSQHISPGKPFISINRDLTTYSGELKALIIFPNNDQDHIVTARVRSGSKYREFRMPVSKAETWACFSFPIGDVNFIKGSNKPLAACLEVEIDGQIKSTTEVAILDELSYRNYLYQLAGPSWDDPIYWDEASEDQIRRLLLSPPYGALFSSLPKTFDKTALFDLLGVTLAGSFNLRPTLPAFELVIDCGERPQTPPHTDLVQLFWLLTMMGSIWADIFFFCSSLSMTLGFNVYNGNLKIALSREIWTPLSPRWIEYDSLNRLIYGFISELTYATMKHDFDWEKQSFEVQMDWKSNPSPRALVAGAN